MNTFVIRDHSDYSSMLRLLRKSQLCVVQTIRVPWWLAQALAAITLPEYASLIPVWRMTGLQKDLLEERIGRTKCVKLTQLEGLTRVIVENVPHGVIKDDIDCRYIVKALRMCAGKADLEVVIMTGQ
jgi:hypothetical protein